VDLAALGVHHDGDGEPLLLVETPHGADDAAVPVSVAVAHVDARHVHPADGERLELGGAAGGRAHGADELGAARATEPVLPQLGARVEDGVGGGADPAWVGERGEVRRSGAEAQREAGAGAGGEAEEWERGGGGVRLGGCRWVEEGVGGGGSGGHGDGGGAERSGVWDGLGCGVAVILLVFGRGGGACEAGGGGGGGGALRLSRVG
jgi:hypothetical protein